ncbi:hypothetical protein LEAN103870_17400 [Legionella anisa]|uniref:Uncharacterized protein n=1 Tax=Legionella anisa TaxID=28082 RepID=A0AAX0WU74_9GAMM|nr:hypothetical protein [Legionella anisa]AWN74052.1 hypothetical protein DLD14_09475 [Legionella anisa]KTC74539.1 hypothetical protein Lani_0740 [Legionella anisa]MBN5936885.1 hypothetical protein [Legionella anisa]MCW8425928.1 hypothetical protein [Legionella anisa]MCW8448640.1 hypothetical protein [Legionella anisa]
MKEKKSRIEQKLLQIERIGVELHDLEQQVRALKDTFYEIQTTKKWVPDTYKMKDEIDPNAPDEFNMEPATWKEVEEYERVSRAPTNQEKQQLVKLGEEIRSKERAIHTLEGEMQVAKVMETVKNVLIYLDPKTHKRDIANLQDLARQNFTGFYELRDYISTLSDGKSSVTRALYKAIKESNGSDIDVKLSKVSAKLEERVNVHKNEKSFNFENFKNSFKQEIPHVNIDESSEDERDNPKL